MSIKFIIEDEQYREYRKWIEEHDKHCKFADDKNVGAIGGRLTFSFTPTGLGNVITVSCGCGSKNSKIDLTPYDEW